MLAPKSWVEKGTGILGEMADSRPESGKMQGEPRTPCLTQKQGSVLRLIGTH